MKNKKGFTLVEVVAVLAVTAIISAIAIPAGRNASTKGNEKLCHTAIGAIHKQYDIRKTMRPQEEPAARMAAVMKMHDNVTASNGTYTGICPNSGVYSLRIGSSGEVSLKCSWHDGARPVWDFYSAPGQMDFCTDLYDRLMHTPAFAAMTNDLKVREMLKEIAKNNGQKLYPVSDAERKMSTQMSNALNTVFVWQPVIAKDGSLMMVATNNKDIGKSNPIGTMIYHNGNYYKWTRTDAQSGATADHAAYVSDKTFDPSILGNASTANGMNEYWHLVPAPKPT